VPAKLSISGVKVNVQLPFIAIERTRLLVLDSVHFQQHNFPFFLFFIFLITCAFCGSGCGSGVGSLSKALQSTNTSLSSVPTGSTDPTGDTSTSSATGSPNASSVTTIGVTPSLGSIPAWKTIQFTANVQGTATNKSVTWSALLGVITSSGLYTAPSTAGTDTITAVSNVDPTKFLSMTISITAAAPPDAVNLLKFGNAGFGGDDTNIFQTALNSTAGNGQILEIPAGNYNINPISFPSNSNVFVDAGVTVTANSGYADGVKMLHINSANVTITGADAAVSVFHMRKADYTSGEQRHCMDIEGASNVTISGISCNDSGGDGLYLAGSTNVTVEDCTFDNNRRQGSSITGGVNHVYYLRDHFTNTSGTAPQSGIDIEPNDPGGYLLDVNIEDSYTDGNAGDGVQVSLWLMNSTSQPVGIKILRHHSTGNQRYGYFANNNDPSNAPGTILIQDSFSDQSGSYGATGRFYAANGASLTFQNLTVTNPHVNGPDPSYQDSGAVDVIRGGGGTIPIGNVHFLNITITITNGKSDHYFNFQDGSGIGVVTTGANRVQFIPASLSGATNVPPNGLVNGSGANVLN
jgi:parallel beta-helix repeat protein